MERNAVETGVLLERAREHDRAALEELFAWSLPRLSSILRQRHRLDAETLADTVQDAALQAFLHLPRFEYRGSGSFLSWLARIAEFEYRRRQRYQRAVKRSMPGTAPCSECDVPAPPRLSPDAVLSRRELRDRVRSHLQRLPARERRALELRLELGRTAHSVQQELGLPSVGAARALLSRARARLAEEMGRDAGA